MELLGLPLFANNRMHSLDHMWISFVAKLYWAKDLFSDHFQSRSNVSLKSRSNSTFLVELQWKRWWFWVKCSASIGDKQNKARETLTGILPFMSFGWTSEAINLHFIPKRWSTNSSSWESLPIRSNVQLLYVTSCRPNFKKVWRI